MAGTRWRALALAAAAVALTATACGKADESPPPANATTGTGDSAIGAAPQAEATVVASSPGATTGGGSGGGNAAPTYPKDAKAYVQELLKAMAKPDYARIAQLGNVAATQQIKDSVTTGGNPNSTWPYLTCTQSTCVARNSHGDQLTVKVNLQRLGTTAAVTEAPLDRTIYPAGPAGYVDELLMAYSEGNAQRMVRLSSDAVKSKIMCTFGKQTTATPLDGTYSKVSVLGLGVDLGKRYEFKVLTASGGKPNAVKEVLAAEC